MTAPVDPRLLRQAVRLTKEGVRALLDELFETVDEALLPNDRIDVVDWCEENLFVPSGVSERSGPVRFSPVQKAIMRLWQLPGVEQVTFIKVPRFGSTLMNAAGTIYFSAHEGWPIIFYERSEGDAQDFHDKVLYPIMLASPAVSRLLRPDTKAGIQDAWTDRVLRNGAPIQLRSVSNNGSFRAIKGRFLCLDEAGAKEYRDRSKNQEGSKLHLIRPRMQQFADGVMYVGGTPTRFGDCTVSEEFAKSNRMRFVMPCPGCEAMIPFAPDVRQVFDRDAPSGAGLRYLADSKRLVSEVWYECECGERIPETRKVAMMEAGHLEATAIGARGHYGVHVWSAYSTDPKSTWMHIADMHQKALADPDLVMQPFFNLWLGLPYDPSPIARIEPTELEKRAEDWLASVPGWVTALFCGVDVQAGSWTDITKPPRIELTVLGSGPNQRRAVIDHQVISHVEVADPFTGEIEKRFVAPFRDGSAEMLWELLEKRWDTEDGRKLQIRRTFVDTGYGAEDVHRFLAHPRTRALRTVLPIMGSGKDRAGAEREPVLPANLRMTPPGKRGGRPHLPIGTHRVKDHLMRMVTYPSPAPGSVVYARHLPHDYYRGLLAETLVEEKPGDRRWRRISKAETGEELDCLVYAYAAERYEAAVNVRFGRSIDVIDPAAQEAANQARIALERAAEAAKSAENDEIRVPERLIQAMTAGPQAPKQRERRLRQRRSEAPDASSDTPSDASGRLARARIRAARGGIGW